MGFADDFESFRGSPDIGNDFESFRSSQSPASAPPTVVEDDSSDVARGFTTAFKQLPQLGYGLLAAAGAAGETAFGEGGAATDLKGYGVKKYVEAGADIAKDAKATDSLTYSWDRAKEGDYGAMVDWLQYGIGYGGAQALQALASAGIGAVAGRVGLKSVAENVAAGMVSKEAARIAATTEGKNLAADQLQRVAVANAAAKIGQTVGIGAQAYGMEGGEIFGDLAQKSVEQGRTLSGAELAKAFGATAAAGTLEFVTDKLGVDLALGKTRIFKAADTMTGAGGKLARIATGAATQMPIEAATEFAQTGLEEYGKGNESSILPWDQSDENFRQAIDAAGLGAVGGGQSAVTGGLLSQPVSRAAQTDAIIAAKTPDEAIAASDPSAAPTPVVAEITGANSVKEALDNLPSIEDIEGLLTTPIAPSIPPVQVGMGNVQTGRTEVSAGPAYDAAAVMPAPQQSVAMQQQPTVESQSAAIEPPPAPVVPDTPAVMQPQQQDEQPTAPAPRQAPPEAINRQMANAGEKEKRVLPLTLDGATRTANKLTNIGYPSRVIPHGEVAGRYRVVAADSPDIDNQAHAAATSPHNELPEPTPAQKEAGNYAKGHVTIDGMDISIENPQGSVRKGGSGKSAWKTTMQHHYGYIRGTVGRDKDHIDVFIKPGTTTSPQVFVVDQINPSTEKFDEHKVVLGAATEEEAAAIYRANYGKDWRGLGEINAMSADAFRKWLASGKTDQPISYREPVTVRTRRKTNSTRELLQAIISLGGLNVAMKNDVGGDSGARYRPGLFTRNGRMDLDLLADELIAYGYEEHIPTATAIGKSRELEDLIRRALGGERILASWAEQEERDKAERAPIWDEARAAGIRTAGRKFNDVLDDVLRLRQTMQQREVEALDEQARKDYDTLVGEARALMVREVDDIIESIPGTATPREALDYLVANLLPLVESRIYEVNGELHITAADQLREENDRRYIEPAENDQATGEQPGETGGAATGDRRDGEGSFLTNYDGRDLEAKEQREQDEQVAAQAAAERERDVFALTAQAAPQKETGRTQQGGLFTPDGRAAADAKGKPPDEPVAPQPTETVSSEAVVTFDDRLRKATEGKTVTVNAKVAGFETVTPLTNQDAAEVVSQLRRDVAALDALRICMGA